MTSIEFLYTVYETYLPLIDVNLDKIGRQKDRMRYRAKWQALVVLERNKGCPDVVSSSESLRIVLEGN